MGWFSWTDCESGRPILIGSEAYVLVPKEFGGGHIKEEDYEGYGEFGDFDIYDLVVDWNINYLDEVYQNIDTWENDDIHRHKDYLDALKNGQEINCKRGDFCEKRNLGIDLACYDEDNARLHYPIKITYNKDAVYEMCGPSRWDPEQGEVDWYDTERRMIYEQKRIH